MPDLRPEEIETYLSSLAGKPVHVTGLAPLGDQVRDTAIKGHGYGHPVLIEYETAGTHRRTVLETLPPGPFGHEHMADRAAMVLWDFHAFNRLPRHARAVDVGAFEKGGGIVSLGKAEEFFILTDYVEGRGYIHDLTRLQAGGGLTSLDLARADALCDYLVEIHAVRGTDPGLYARRVRELVGHGECIMGLCDSYPDAHAFITPERLERIERACVSWRWKLKGRTRRLRQVHGDFHPYNILFREGTDFSVLDRSRGEWGEPADDVTCLTGNFLFYALQQRGRFEGVFATLFRRFWDRYLDKTGDREVLEVAAPFFAFRCLVMASPVWYPTLDEAVRRKLFAFLEGVLAVSAFDPGRVETFFRG
ncbi:MAG: aminoglycoside phosphotransferase family protein [Deltaproteobacteria bacterium]|nr:aminoglycoside phosphotransferase family protein [Deltaproteobacteria bacterium]